MRDSSNRTCTGSRTCSTRRSTCLHLARRDRLAARHPPLGQRGCALVRPGGRFYISEVHPVAQVLEDENVGPGQLVVRYPYWEHREPIVFPVQGSYADPSADVGVQEGHGWDHGLGEIVTALIDAGLRIDSLREFDFVEWPLPFLIRSPDGRYRLPPEVEGQLPLFFSLLATRPG